MLRAFSIVYAIVAYLFLNLSESYRKDPLSTSPLTAVAQIVSTGSCSLFAVIGATKINFGGRISTIANGLVGIHPGGITGNGFDKYMKTALAEKCESTDLIAAYELIKTLSCPSNNSRNEVGGQILTEGVYCSAGAHPMTLSADLTLNGSPTDIWFFQTHSSLIISQRSKMILTGGALAKNVFWAVGKDAILGYSSNLVGTLIAIGSIFIEEKAKINGQVLSAATVSFYGGNFVINPNAKLLETDPD